ncbi:MAG: ATP phosphoribosyltransferase [Acidobacteriota bacterium]
MSAGNRISGRSGDRPLRLALPKGRNQVAARQAFAAAGYPLNVLDDDQRKLMLSAEEEGFELLLLKDWDIPLYVQYGIADFGIVGSDVLEEVDGDLLVPVRLVEGRCRLSFIGTAGSLPKPGAQVRLATKFPNTARSVLAERPWGAEVVKLHGSIELGPILGLSDLALDIVQTGRTLKDNDLVELEVVREVAPCLVLNRGSWHHRRDTLNEILERLEEAEVVR